MWYNVHINRSRFLMDKHVFTDKQKKLIAWAAIAIFLLLSAAVDRKSVV